MAPNLGRWIVALANETCAPLADGACASEFPYKALGAQLRRIREAAGLRQEDLARELGCSRPSVVAYEQGRGRPKLALLHAWSMHCRHRLVLSFEPNPDTFCALDETVLG